MNVRLPADYKEKVEVITEYYQSKISLGRVSQADVMKEIIRKEYESIMKIRENNS